MHHANLLVGTKTWVLDEVPCDCSVETPDLCLRFYEKMSIKDVRALIHEASLRPVIGDTRTFVLYIERILHEAQNGLLKLFEEPNDQTIFYVGVEDEGMLLPTLRSRFMLYAREVVEEDKVSFDTFRKGSYADRLALIAEKTKAGDQVWMHNIVRGFSLYAHKKQEPTLIRDVLMLEKYFKTNGASKKMLLEHLALSV